MYTKEKDITGFNRVYEENANQVFRTALCYLNNNTYLAEEITQNVFLKLYDFSDTYNEPYLSAWLITVTKNEALNCISKCSREVPEEEINQLLDSNLWENGVEEKVVAHYEKEERIATGRSILDNLYSFNPRWYEAVTLVYCMEKKQADVAEKMGISLSVLHSMLYRARKWLKKNLSEENSENEIGE